MYIDEVQTCTAPAHAGHKSVRLLPSEGVAHARTLLLCKCKVAPMTSCAPADVNYNLCVVLVEHYAALQDRVDLIWYGTWALVGLTFVVLLAQKWYNAFRVTRGG